MKVCIIQNSIRTVLTFRESYIRILVREYKADVTVIAPIDCIYACEKLRELGVSVIGVPYFKFAFGRVFSNILINYHLMVFRLFNYNAKYVCHFLSTFFFVFPTLVPFNKNVNVYVEGLGSFFSGNTFFSKLLFWMITFDNVSRFFCNNDEKEVFGLDSDIVTNGVGVNLLKFSPSQNRAVGTGFELLYVGRLIDDKGVFDAINLLDGLLTEHVNVRLTLVGDIYPSNPSSLSENDIKTLKVKYSSSIEFVPFTQDIQRYYQNADMLVLLSKLEGFPVCVMEASASGTPTVCYDVPGCNSAISVGDNGFLIPYKNHDELANQVKSYINDGIMRRLMPLKCREYAEINFCSDHKARVFLNEILKGEK